MRALIVGSIVISHAGFAQQRELNILTTKLQRHRALDLQEKLYAHLDQTFYFTGETMWFSIYTTDGTLHKPLTLSTVAYLEIVDKNNTAVLQSKIALEEGRGNGSLFLPASLHSGNYTVRFYTRWMLNFSPEFYYHTIITILNPFTTPEAEKKKTTIPYVASFFPEGGHLVAGIKSKVAFKVTDNAGKGIDYTGELQSTDHETVLTFSPFKFGIGNFSFTPVSGKQYQAVIKDSNGQTHTFALPLVQPVGYCMRVEDSTDTHLRVTVTSQGQAPSSIPFVFLFVHARQMILKAEASVLQSNTAVFIISKNDLADGINHLTLFDVDSNPLCERLYFKQPSKKLSIAVTGGQKQYGRRRKVSLRLQATDTTGHPVPADLSVAVYKIDSLTIARRDGIFEYLWLSSDLTGTLESPEYYISDSDSVNQAADNLMLTHGWRRFTWKDVLGVERKYEYLPEVRGHMIQGRVSNTSGLSNTDVVTYLATPEKIVQLYGARSDSKGNVQYEVNFRGMHELILQTNPQQDSLHTIEIKNPFSSQFSTEPLPPLHLVPKQKLAIESRSIAMQVQDLYYGDTLKLAVSAVDSIAFYGKADATYFLDDYTRFPVMEEIMREYVPGVFVRKRKDGFHFIVPDAQHKTVLFDNPMVLLDGIPLFDVDKIMAFDPLKVKRLDVVSRKYYLGPLILSGIVSYTTYQGDLGDIQLNPRWLKINYEGLQQQREFYSPVYENQKQRGSRLPDRRSLLYWNPSITTNGKDEQTIEFYTSDTTGEYEIRIEGLTTGGFAGKKSAAFSVKQIDY